MDRINNLLNQVSIIGKKNAEILDATGGQFIIMKIHTRQSSQNF